MSLEQLAYTSVRGFRVHTVQLALLHLFLNRENKSKETLEKAFSFILRMFS